MRKKRWSRIILLLIIIVVIGELIVRFVFGLESVPTYSQNDNYEYIFKPNQNFGIPGGQFYTDSHGLRMSELTEQDTIVILKVGDSVLNGGRLMGHDDLATSIVQRRLNDMGIGIKIVNLSMGSWGPDNAMGYLKKHLNGVPVKAIFMVFSSHDLFDYITGKAYIDYDPKMPSERPVSILYHLFMESVWPKLVGKKPDLYPHPIPAELGTSEIGYNGGWQLWYDYAKSMQLPIVVYHHPEQVELEVYSRWVLPKGEGLEMYLREIGYETILDGRKYGFKPEHYRDNIHFNEAGQQHLALVLEQLCFKHFPELMN